MATVQWGRRQPFEDATPYEPPAPPPVSSGPVAVQPWTDLTGSKLPHVRQDPTAPTVQPYAQDTGLMTRAPGSVTTQPVATAPGPSGSSGGFGAASRGTDPATYVQAWQQQFGYAPTATSLDALVNALHAEGWTGAKRADHNGQPSNDKIDLGNGQSADIIFSEGTPDARWVWQPYSTSGSTGGGGGGGSDPNSELYFNELLSRMQQLRQGVNDPMAPLYQLMALQRVNSLQGDPFTSGNDAALTARYMNPLTQARDTELQQNKERISARGMAGTSGLLDALNQTTNQHYTQGVAAGANDLGVRAVQEKQARQQQALQILADLLTQGRSMREENNQQANELIDRAAAFPAFDDRRMAQLLQASGDTSAAQGTQALVQQQSTQLLDAYRRATTKAEQQALLGQYINLVINNLDKIWK